MLAVLFVPNAQAFRINLLNHYESCSALTATSRERLARASDVKLPNFQTSTPRTCKHWQLQMCPFNTPGSAPWNWANPGPAVNAPRLPGPQPSTQQQRKRAVTPQFQSNDGRRLIYWYFLWTYCDNHISSFKCNEILIAYCMSSYPVFGSWPSTQLQPTLSWDKTRQ